MTTHLPDIYFGCLKYAWPKAFWLWRFDKSCFWAARYPPSSAGVLCVKHTRLGLCQHWRLQIISKMADKELVGEVLQTNAFRGCAACIQTLKFLQDRIKELRKWGAKWVQAAFACTQVQQPQTYTNTHLLFTSHTQIKRDIPHRNIKTKTPESSEWMLFHIKSWFTAHNRTQSL